MPAHRTLAAASLALAAALTCASGARAADLAWASDAANNLWQVNFSAGSATLIGNTGIFVQELAYSPSGVLHATTGNGQLYQINPQTAAATWIGSTQLGNIEALDYVGTDLIAANFAQTPTFYRIDPTTGGATWMRDAAASTGVLRSMEWLNQTTVIARGDAQGGTLFRIDLSTGSVVNVGAMPAMIAGLEAIGTRMYGVGDDGQLYRVNPSTGAVTLLADVGNQYFTGLASVPTPGAAGLLGLGGLAAARRRR